VGAKSNAFELAFLKLVFRNENIANVGDATGLRGSSSAGNLYAGLYTADPGEAGDQTTNEAAYTSYARVAISRATGSWNVTGNGLENASAISFPACTGGSATVMFVGIGTDSSGAGTLLYKAPLGTNLGPFVGEADDDLITIKGHGLSVSDRVVFFAPTGSSLPTGVAEGTVYFVKTAPSADTITISATDGGATINLTADGDGWAFKVVPLAVSNGITPEIAAGSLDVFED